MNSKNMNYAFMVEYMNDILKGSPDEKAIKGINNSLLRVLNSNIGNILNDNCKKMKTLKEKVKADLLFFKTEYPGLLIGTGYPHDLKGAKGGIQIGFSFDYVTGSPFYPGSSLKGILRSIFDKATVDEEYLELINHIIDKKYNFTEIKVLTEAIFGNESQNTKKVVAGRDVFYDSLPVDSETGIIGLDNLTPHISPTKSPIPITMLRIMPNVTIALPIYIDGDVSVKINDSEVKITKEERELLYKNIIEMFGIGAKTNVGYGSLSSADCDLEKKHINPDYQATNNDCQLRAEGEKKETNSQRRAAAFEVKKEYQGKITGHNKSGKYAYVDLDGGAKASFFDGGKQNDGDRVTLIYQGEELGKDGLMHPKWNKK